MAMDFGRVRGVLFDVDGTLYHQAPLRACMALELARLALRDPRNVRRQLTAIQAYRRAQERLRAEGGPGSAAAQLEAAAAASGLPVAEVERLVDEFMQTRPLRYLQICRRAGLLELLSRLGRAGIRMGVLSDYPAADKLQALGLAGRFSPVLCATDPDIGAFKPSPRGFLRACEVWQLEPADVLYVGDRADVDAAGAAAAGMRCAIISRRAPDAPASPACAVFPSFERLSRVFDAR